MTINSKLASFAAVSAIAGATFLGVNSASAQSDSQSLVSKIAERFGVSETEVQTVVDEHRADQHEEREVARSEHLQSLVDDGTISEEQKTALEAFQEKRQAQLEDLRSQEVTREEIREAMEALRDEMQTWAEEQGLNLDDIRPEMTNGGHGKRGGFDRGFNNQEVDEEAEAEQS